MRVIILPARCARASRVPELLLRRRLSERAVVDNGEFDESTRQCALLAVLTRGAIGASAGALADNPLGAYVGAGVGQSNVGNNDYYDYGYYGGYRDTMRLESDGGDPAAALRRRRGRSTSISAAATATTAITATTTITRMRARIRRPTVLYGVGYLPLPLPFLDVYGKVGVARLQNNITPIYTITAVATARRRYSACSAPIAYRTDQTDTKFAYGAGVQAKWQDFAFRAEYERISSQFGDPAAFTVGVSWTF